MISATTQTAGLDMLSEHRKFYVNRVIRLTCLLSFSCIKKRKEKKRKEKKRLCLSASI